LHPGPGLTQPSVLSWSVNEYGYGWEDKAGMCDACLVRAMYLSASAVGRAYKGAL